MLLSVVLPVYNNAPFLDRAVASILAQSHRDFEFIIINDGSTDGSTAILRRLAAVDVRIRLIEQDNLGLVASLNRGFALAGGDRIARMDGDDESMPERFATQLAFLDAHPDYGVVGGQLVTIDADSRILRRVDRFPLTHDEFLGALERGHPLSHPSAMIDRRAFERVGGYRALYRHCEDYDLWLRLSAVTKLCSTPEVLHRYRVDDSQITARHPIQVAIGAAVAWEAHRARQASRPDPSEMLATLPDADGLDALDDAFGAPGVARRVRAAVAPKLLYSVPAITDGAGVRLLARYLAENGARLPVARAVARLVRHGRLAAAVRLAAALSQALLMPRSTPAGDTSA